MSERDMDTLEAAALFACLTEEEQKAILEAMRSILEPGSAA